MKVRISDLIKHRNQDELGFSRNAEAVITALVEDIRRNGLLDAPFVRMNVAAGGWEIVSGHKRTEACRRLGWEFIEVREKDDLDQAATDLLHVTSNTARANVTFSQRVAIYQRYAPDFFKSKRIARKRANEVSALLAINPNTILKDIQRIRNPEQEAITVEKVSKAWNSKNRGHVRLNVVEADAGYIVFASGKNFQYQSGPDELHKALWDSYKKATSTYFDREFKRGNISAGTEIRKIRTQLKLTQIRMAERLGVSQSYYAEIEAGKYDAAKELLEACQLMLSEEV
jgi:DNA-binding XRE family transcriptional regulator